MGDSFKILVNPPFKMEWDGQEYDVKKANLEQVALFQQRSNESLKNGTGGNDTRLAAYAIWLILSKVIPDITEQEILEKVSGDTDLMELFVSLGFMNPARFQTAMKAALSPSTTENSGATSVTEQDGLPNK
jgi:hypothetical protein